MNANERVIPSRRGSLIIQSFVVIFFAAGVGLFLQSWKVIQSSPLGRVGSSLGFPVIAVVVAALGLWLVIALVKDSWGHRVVLGATSLTINDSLGSYTVPYGAIEKVQSIPMGGVVIGFRDREQWLAHAAGAADIRRRTSHVGRSTYAADVLISKKQLAIDAEEFVALLQQRATGLAAPKAAHGT